MWFDLDYLSSFLIKLVVFLALVREI